MTELFGPSAPPAAGGAPKQLVILLHGVGADGQDLISLAQPLGHMLPHAHFVAPDAPEPCDMAPMGRQWFSLQDRTPSVMLAGIQRSMPILNTFIDAELTKAGLKDQDLAVVGFSQGTMMSLYTVFRRQKQMAAFVGYAGAMLGGETLAAEAVSKPPICLVHGDADSVVPVEALHAAVAQLQAVKIPVEGHVRPGLVHGIDPEGIALGGAFLARAFGVTTS